MMRLIKDLGLIYPTETSKSKRRYGIFECPICKQEVKTAMYHVKTGNSTKCKSCATKINKSIHGGKGTRLYGIWKDMKKRCYSNNKNSRCYKDYRSRGIKVCKEWKDDFTNFRKWSLENGYKENLTIDRIKNDKDYTPTNCRWTTYNIQARNTRRLMITNKTGYRGVSYSIKNRKFKAQITVNKHVKHLGFFNTKEEAAEVYDNFILENNLEHTTNKDNK